MKIILQQLCWQEEGWKVLTCLFVVGARLLHCVCTHLNICNDKYSWFSYRFVTLTGTMKHSGHPGKWSSVYSNAPSPPRLPALRSPARALVVIFISQNRYSPCEVAACRVESCWWLLRDRCFKVKQWRRAEGLTSQRRSACAASAAVQQVVHCEAAVGTKVLGIGGGLISLFLNGRTLAFSVHPTQPDRFICMCLSVSYPSSEVLHKTTMGLRQIAAGVCVCVYVF